MEEKKSREETIFFLCIYYLPDWNLFTDVFSLGNFVDKFLLKVLSKSINEEGFFAINV